MGWWLIYIKREREIEVNDWSTPRRWHDETMTTCASDSNGSRASWNLELWISIWLFMVALSGVPHSERMRTAHWWLIKSSTGLTIGKVEVRYCLVAYPSMVGKRSAVLNGVMATCIFYITLAGLHVFKFNSKLTTDNENNILRFCYPSIQLQIHKHAIEPSYHLA